MWRGRRQVVLAGSGGDGMMVYGNFGWTRGDLEARSSPWHWEAFWGCLYLWKSLQKEINHTPSRNHSGCWRARQCRAGFVPGPPGFC